MLEGTGILAPVGLCLLLTVVPATAQPEDPAPEQVELNGAVYDVPPPWRGNRIEEAADPTALARVPSELTGELGIYVTPETRDAVVAMAAAAREQGIRLEVDSGFRSYGFQKRVLEGLLAKGRPFLNAIRWTAPPGYSEHITGRAVDFVPSDADFKDVPGVRVATEARRRLLLHRELPARQRRGFRLGTLALALRRLRQVAGPEAGALRRMPAGAPAGAPAHPV